MLQITSCERLAKVEATERDHANTINWHLHSCTLYKLVGVQKIMVVPVNDFNTFI